MDTPQAQNLPRIITREEMIKMMQERKPRRTQKGSGRGIKIKFGLSLKIHLY